MKNKIISILLAIITISASVAILYVAVKYNANKPEATEGALGLSMYIVYSVMALAFISLVGFAIWSVISNFTESKSTLIGVGVLLAVLIIGFLLSSSTSSLVEQKFAVTPSISKLVGGGLLATYIFMFGALLAAIWSTISSRFK